MGTLSRAPQPGITGRTGDTINNVAIGVNFNVGSVLRGGSLYLTFKED